MLAAGTLAILGGDLLLKYWPHQSASRPDTDSGHGDSADTTRDRAVVTAPVSGPPAQTSKPVPQTGRVNDRAPPPVAETPPPVQTPPPAADATPADPAIADARQMMEGGHVASARKMLLRPDLAASQEGAWLLARSYDPNYIATLQSPDAPPDRQQAEQWYRRWRDIAAQNGMVMDDQRLNRIINSMR